MSASVSLQAYATAPSARRTDATPIGIHIASPVFIVGAKRSGTTLLGLLLDHHPDICFQGEFGYAVHFLKGDGSPPPLAEYHAKLVLDRVFRATGFIIDRSLEYHALLKSFIVQMRRGTGKHIVGSIVHERFDHLLRYFPNSRFIHLVRDGRDVANSVVAMGWSGNIWDACRTWIEAEALWEHFVRRLPPDRYITVRYEELVADPQRVLSNVCTFLRTRFDARMLEIDRDTNYSQPDPSLALQWRRRMSKTRHSAC